MTWLPTSFIKGDTTKDWLTPVRGEGAIIVMSPWRSTRTADQLAFPHSTGNRGSARRIPLFAAVSLQPLSWCDGASITHSVTSYGRLTTSVGARSCTAAISVVRTPVQWPNRRSRPYDGRYGWRSSRSPGVRPHEADEENEPRRQAIRCAPLPPFAGGVGLPPARPENPGRRSGRTRRADVHAPTVPRGPLPRLP